MRRHLLLLGALFMGLCSHAQLSGTKTIPGDYPDLATAVSELNAQGVGAGGVIFELAAGHTESTADSILITATGTAANPIVFQKSGGGPNPLVTRTGAGLLSTSSLGAAGDAVIIIEGSDYVTFDGIDVATADQGIEYGYLIRRASATDGAKNVTIRNATIALTKGTSAYVIGILTSNVLRNGSVSSATGVTVTSTGGRHENLTFTGNTIRNVFAGIYLRGFAASSPYDLFDQNITVGTSGAGNTIVNFGGNAASTTYGVYAIYQNNIAVRYNVIDNMASGGTGLSSTGYGIFFSTGTNANATAENNNIKVTSSAASSATYGINNAFTGALVISNNTVALEATATSTGTFGYIYNTAATSATTIHNNNFLGTTLPVSGTTTLIHNNNGSSAPMSVKNNRLTGTLNRTGATGDMRGYYNNGSPTNVEELANNNFSNIVLTGSSSFTGITSTTNSANTQQFYNNTISNITTGTGTSHGMNLTTAGTRNIYDNQIHTITGGGTVYGILSGSGFTAGAVYKNKIYGLASSGTGTGTLVYGISASSGAPALYNNIIGDLTAPAATGTEAIRGISITTTSTSTNVKVYHNTVYLNAASTGTNFGSTGLYVSTSTTATTAALDLRNNIIVNNSTPSGTGLTVAYRRSSTALNNYTAASNSNLLYAGAPAPNRLLFYDGTNSAQTLAAFQARVTPADAQSISEMPPFVSTTGSNAGFLHIDATVPTRIESGGQPIADVTEDFDGDARDANTPDIGADEFAGIPVSDCSGTPTAGTITGPATVCTGAGRTLILSGQSTSNGIEYQWKYSDVQGGPYTNIAGATNNSLLTGNLTATRYYVAVVRCVNSGQSVETPEFTLQVTPLPVITVSPATSSVCDGGNVALTASGASTYVWSPSTNLSATTGATVTATPTITRTYTATGTDANGCVSVGTATVVVNPVVTATATATPAVICSGGSSQLQASSTYRNYRVSQVPLSPVSPSGTPTVLADNGVATVALTSGTLEDGRWSNIAIPFAFNFYGTDYTAINISTNGYATFGTVSTNVGFAPTLPSTSTPNNAVHFLSSDLDFRSPSTGRIEYFTNGTAPNRQFVINVDNASFFEDPAGSQPGTASVQVIFFEGSNAIEVHTTNLTNTTALKTQGVENSTGNFAVAVPGRNATANWTSAPDAVRFAPSPLDYSWTPATFLDNPAIANPTASNVTATTVYTVTATDAVTGCSGTATVTLTAGNPLTAAATANATAICNGTAVTLNATPTGGGQPYTYSWSDGSTVVSTAQSFSVSPTANTTYTVTVSDACGSSVTSAVSVTVNNPAITASTPGARCGQGTVTLQASGAAGTTVNWYAAPTGGSALGSGTSFTTPVISASTTFYAAASLPGDNVNLGRLAPAGGTGTVLTTYGQDFTVTKTITLNSVDVVSTTGTSITVSLFSAGGSTQLETTGARTVPTNTTSVISLGWTITPGTYRLVANGMTGNFIRENSGVTYPISLGTVGQINGFVSSITGAVTTTASYYFMYNWNIQVPCEGVRTPVTATVNTAPDITVTASNGTVCAGDETTLSVSSPNASYTYTWMPGNLTGASITVTPAGPFTKYYVTASDNSGGASTGCVKTDSVTINVNPAVTVTASAASTTLCAGTSTQLTANAQAFPTVRITEVTQNRTGTGATSPYPAYSPSTANDLVEISNLSTLPTNVGGLVLEVWEGTAINRSITLPANTTIPAQTVSVIHIGTGTDDAANLYFNTGGATNDLLSSTPIGYVLKYNGSVVDAMATNGYTWPAVAGVTATDWSGAAPTTSGAGLTRTAAVDNNKGSDWSAATAASLMTIGTYNAGYQPLVPAQLSYSWTPAAGLSDAAISNPVATPAANTEYIVTVTNTLTGCFARDTVNLVVTPAVAITAQPQSEAVCAFQPLTLSVTATNAVSYQWKKDGNDIPGATGSSLFFTGVSAADAGSYTVVVTGTAPCAAVTSAAAVITVNAKPEASFTASSPACAGSPVTFTNTSTVAGGTIAGSAWIFGDNNNATGANPSHSYANPGIYSVRLVTTSNTGCTDTVSATVQVNPGTAITQQPASAAVCPGSAATFTVTATGENLAYQWKKDGADIAGATSATYSIASVASANAGSYTVVVTGACGTLSSNAAVLTVNAANVWTGAVSSDWNNPANWCGNVPTSTANVSIPAGVPNMPQVSGSASVNNLTLGAAATVTVPAGSTLNLYGNLVQGATGGLNVNGTLAFRGATQQTVPAMFVANLLMDGAGGVSLQGDFGVQNTLTFTNGNITLNSGLFDVNTIVGGSASSKFISNGGGYIRTTAISAGPVMVPVAPDAASYNPVTIANGGGHSYRVSVKQGLNPAIAWPANAVNRTWSVTPLTTVAVPVTITLGYSDADGGSAFNPLGMMEAGVHNSNWILTTAAGGVAATGTSALRSVTTTTTGTNFGPMVVGNVGSILLVTAVPTIDADVTLLQLLPNVVAQNTVLRVAVRRTLQSQWVLTDAQGRVVRSFRQSLTVGTNDLRLSLGDLAAGTYFLQGSSSKGAIGTLRLVKQ